MKLILACLAALYLTAVEGAPDSCAYLPEPRFCLFSWYRYWYYHALKRKCIQWDAKGCSGGHNNFGTKEDCENSCSRFDRSQLCSLKADKGPCQMDEWRFYYNSNTGICESFIYGGCGGNQNNFGSKKTCYQACRCGYTFPLNGHESAKYFTKWSKFGDV